MAEDATDGSYYIVVGVIGSSGEEGLDLDEEDETQVVHGSAAPVFNKYGMVACSTSLPLFVYDIT